MANETKNAFRVGSVLSRSFGVYFRNIIPFGILSLVAWAILAAVQWGISGNSPFDIAALAPVEPGLELIWMGAANVVAYLLIVNLLTATLIYGTVQDLRGARAGVGACLAQGFSVIVPVMGISIIVGFATIVGLLLVVIPGVIIFLMFWIVVPVAVIERPGLGKSLSRSRELTKGSRWRIISIVLIIIVLGALTGGIGGYFVGLVQGPAGGAVQGVAGVAVVNFLVSALLTGFGAVVTAVGYNALRLSKEGVDIDQIAAVFD